MALEDILTGGAASRSDSISGLDPQFRAVIEAMIAGAPPDIAKELQIRSAYRSPELQAQLWAKELAEHHGNVAEARRWVAPPPGVEGSKGSRHGFGKAIDWSYASDRARSWARANAAKFGGAFPLGNEPWHMELAGARGGGGTTPVPSTQGVSLASNPVTTPTGIPAPSATPAAAPTEIAGLDLGGLEDIASGISGGRQQAQPAPIQPSNIGAEVAQADQKDSSGAAQLLASLLANSRNRYGLSLTGMV